MYILNQVYQIGIILR